MENGIFFSIISFFYCMFATILFFSKKKIKNKETMIYGILLIVNLIGLFIETVPTTIAIRQIIPCSKSMTVFFLRLILIYLIIWLSLFTYYVISLSIIEAKKRKKIIQIGVPIIICSCIVIMNLPLYYYINNGAAYSYGAAANFVYAISAIFIIICIFSLSNNIKKVGIKKYFPLITLLFLGSLVIIIQYNYPELTLMLSLHTFVLLIMYFTIENPDTKMLKEMHDAKEISDNANEEKTLFLYNMTQEIRNTTKNIDTEANTILDSDSLDIDKDSARNIKGETSKFRTMTNDILDVSAIDASNIKIYNSKYDLKLLLRTLISSYNDVCKNKAVNFRTNIEHNIPNTLYGDSINLKKVISLLLSYSVGSTNKGFVEFNVNTIIKNDICRLVITIEDSSMGIRSDELERVKIDNKNISQAYKMLTVMNGTMILTSNYGIGTKIKIVLDQRIDLEDKEEKKYYEVYNDKKILVVDDNESSIKIIEKLLKGTDIVIESVLTGREALAKIKIKNRYDLILLDESLSQISGEELLKKFKSFRNFNIPVILLSKDNKYEYNEEYIKMGFNDILIKPLKKDELIKIINNYIKRDEL